MARYYSTFDNSTVSALEAVVSGKAFLRVAMTGGATLKAALISARSDLDAAIRSQITLANNDGSLGVVVPSDQLVRGGSNTTGTFYTNADADYHTDPSIRPTADILAAGSTITSPADTFSIANTTLDAARTAVNNAATAAGVYSRLGVDAAKTLRSLWHALDLSYFAWDSFTPEIAVAGTVFSAPTDPAQGDQVTIHMEWQDGHPTDTVEAVADWFLTCQNVGVISGESPSSTGDVSITGSGTVAVGGTTTRNVSATGTTAGLVSGMTYVISGTVQLRYTSGVVGPILTVTSAPFDVHHV
jgi:hypothetical protein